jgi:hypothetical protein
MPQPGNLGKPSHLSRAGWCRVIQVVSSDCFNMDRTRWTEACVRICCNVIDTHPIGRDAWIAKWFRRAGGASMNLATPSLRDA